MLQHIKALIAVAIGTAVMLTALLGPSLLEGQQTDPANIISQPTEWIAYTYDFRMRESDGDELSYTLHQSSDGSRRRDRIDGQEIQITNRQSGKYYRYHHGWVEHPMRAQPAGGKPFLKLNRSRVMAVPATDPRVQAVVAGAPGLDLSFYERSSAAEATIFCPELNMLEVWQRRPRGAETVETQVTRVTLGEPRVEFHPPTGADVRVSSEPSGPGLGPWPEAARSRLKPDAAHRH